jgi:hypothetical protein
MATFSYSCHGVGDASLNKYRNEILLHEGRERGYKNETGTTGAVSACNNQLKNGEEAKS